MADEIADSGVSWDILDGRVTMQVVPRDDGDLRVRFADDDGETIWSEIYERGFWESRTHKGEIKNKLADNSAFSSSNVKEDLEQVWTELIENTEEYEQALISPSVDQLIENTQAVEVHGGGEETEYHVYVRARPFGTIRDKGQTDGGASERKLTFTNEDWARSDGDTQIPPVVEKYSSQFYEVLDISWQEWRDDIRPRWRDMQEVVSDLQTSTADRIAQSVVRSLRRRLDVHTDAEKMLSDVWNGWYEENSKEHGGVVWVTGDTLDEALEQHGKGIDYRSPLSRALQNQGLSMGNSKQTTVQGDPVELYPFDLETLGVPKIDIIGLDHDDDQDDEADDGDGESVAVGDTVDAVVRNVVETLEKEDPLRDGIQESELIVACCDERDIAPPDDVQDAIEEAVLKDLIRRVDEDTLILSPGDDDPDENLDTDEDGVPDP